MFRPLRLLAIVLPWLILAIVSFVRAPAFGQTVDWIPGVEPPAEWDVWIVDPTEDTDMFLPQDTDRIGFRGPTNRVHSNSGCAQVAAGGVLGIAVDPTVFTIELYFQPPGGDVCIALWDPVGGLEGEFGPLAPGEWTFFGNNPVATFTESFLVTPAPGTDGDMDGDGNVDDGDLNRFLSDLPGTLSTQDRVDLNTLLGNFGRMDMPVQLTAVPEPFTLTLASLGLLGLVAYASRRRKKLTRTPGAFRRPATFEG